MSQRPESFKKRFCKTVYLLIGKIGTNNQCLGFLDFFCKLRKIIFNFADIIRNTLFTGKARSDVNPAQFHKFGFQFCCVQYGPNKSVRVTVFYRTPGNSQNFNAYYDSPIILLSLITSRIRPAVKHRLHPACYVFPFSLQLGRLPMQYTHRGFPYRCPCSAGECPSPPRCQYWLVR